MSIEKSAKTVDEAIKLALDELGASTDDVNVEVLETAKSGFLGFGQRDAKVLVSLKKEKIEENSLDSLKNETNEKKESVSLDDIEKIKKFLLDLIKNMNTTAEVSFKEDDEALNFYVEKSNDFNMLIGKSGETLDSIQYILNIFARRNCTLEKRIYLDINGYKVKKEENIRQMAMSFAKKAIKYRKVMRLRPMNAYERRIVHSTIHNMKGVFTVSEGEEPYRKVVIKPKF